jgi:hypothetical protein
MLGDAPETQWVLTARPLLLPFHEDPELGQPMTHAHFDYRFCSNRQLKQVRRHAEALLGHPMSDSELVRFISFVPQSLIEDLFEIRWFHRKCYRAFPDFDYPILSAQQRGFLRQFVGKPLDCGQCPHRGLYVMNLPRVPSQPHRVVCRGHGLTIDVEQQVVVDSPTQGIAANRFLDVFNLTVLATSEIPQLETIEPFFADLDFEWLEGFENLLEEEAGSQNCLEGEAGLGEFFDQCGFPDRA